MDLGVTTAIIHTLLHEKNVLKTLYVDADQNAPITTQIFANILFNSQSATMWDATEFTLRGQCAKDPHKNNIKHHHTHKQTYFITPAALQTQPLQQTSENHPFLLPS